MKAFQVLDVDKKGFLTLDELTKFMRDEGMYELRNECSDTTVCACA